MGSRDVFDLLGSFQKSASLTLFPKTAAEIPPSVWDQAKNCQKEQKQKTGRTNQTKRNAEAKIRSFDFDLDEECFQDGKELKVNSFDLGEECFQDGKELEVNSFDLDEECFQDGKELEVNSLFFEYIFNQNEKFLEESKTSSKQEMKSKLTDKIPQNEDNFFVVNFVSKKFNPGDTQTMFKDGIVENILRKGISANGGQTYNIVGCSNSQVQKRSFYFMLGSDEECKLVIKSFIHDLSALEKKGVAKRTKYIGLLFTGCQYIVNLPEDVKIIKTDDIERKHVDINHNFTDGCGFISFGLADWIWKNNPILREKWKQIPSLWQIRYCGDGKICKGVLIVDYRTENKISITFRSSLIKVAATRNGPVENCLKFKLGIVSTSQNAKIGCLNKQVVALLSANIPCEKLLEIQLSYLNDVKTARNDPISALKCLSRGKQVDSFRRLLQDYRISVIPSSFATLPQNVEILANEKLKLPLACARLLMGASFPETLNSNLKTGECVVLNEFGSFIDGDVVVCRSPSYSPGDIRVLRGVKLPAEHPVSKLRNVILFSTSGERPDPDKMSGGDLDGDLYLVIWDKRVLQYSDTLRNIEPEKYDPPLSKPTSSKNPEDWIRYVALWENSMLAQIDSCFFQLAGEKGISSDDCRELCALFSRAVDQIPSELEQLKQFASKARKLENGPFVQNESMMPIWERMMKNQLEALELIKRRNTYMDLSDWRKFYSLLVSKSSQEIEQVLNNFEIQAVTTKFKIVSLKKSWIILAKNNFQPPKMVIKAKDDDDDDRETQCSEIDAIKSNLLCTYDCTDTTCAKSHSEKLNWHHSWKNTMTQDIDVFIKPVREKIQELKSTLTDQEKKLEKLIDEYNKKVEKVTKEKNVLKTKSDLCGTFLTRVKKSEDQLIIIAEFKRELKQLEDSAKPGFFTSIFRDLENFFAHKFLKRDRKLSQEEEVLIARHKYLNHRKKEAENTLSCVIDEEKHNFEDFRQKLMPEFSIPDLDFGDTKKSVSFRSDILKSWKEEIFKQWKMKVSEMPEVSDEVYDISSKLQSKMNRASGKIETCLDRVEKLTAMKSEIEAYTIKPKKTRVIVRKRREIITTPTEFQINKSPVPSLRETLYKILKTCLEKRTDELNFEIGTLKTRKESLAFKLSQAYDPDLHERTIREIKQETMTVNPFNLALCAAINEVNSRYEVYDKHNSETRVALNRELEMCLLREKNRCQREISETPLPIFSKRFELKELLSENNAVVVVAETGSGKSTQVPQYLADDLFHVLGKPDDYKSPRIACTQPRRVAATKIAHRVRLEYSGSVGIESGAKLEESQPERVFNSSKASIVAYPLYASSGSEERSLNENDRLGWYENLPKDSRAGSQKNIKQEPSLDSRHSGTPAEIGGWVGFQIGSTGKSFEERKNSKKISSGTRIEFVTEGLLLNKLKTQQDSTCYDCIIVDEAHERGKDTDFLMALLRKMLQKEDCKLKVVVMSASIDEEQFSDYFFGCPVLKCRCKMYPVVEHYRPISGNLELETEAETSDDNASDVSEPSEQSDENFSKTLTKNVVHAVDVLFKDVVPNVKGDVLIFLPGKKEIHSAVDLIRTRAEKQFKSSKNSSDYVRKVVCCTNIAETSLTIPGVKFVIDAGQSKKMTYDHESRISALVLQNNSKASAKQRKGRAGRIESGFCYRLCSEADFAELEDFDDPELKQCPIDELYLYAVQVFGSIENLCLMPDAQPDDDSLLFARQRLLNLGFIVENGSDSSQEITQDGEKALSFLGELSLEDVRMIISASNHPIPIVQPALQMAILTKNYSDLTVKTSLQENDESRRMLERRNVFLDELGDCFTLFKLYRVYHDILKQRKSCEIIPNRNVWAQTKRLGVQKWCENLGLSLEGFKFIDKTVNSAYQNLKRNKMLGAASEHSVLPLSSIRKPLLEVLISGYFHNIAEWHDEKLIDSGYSLITPANIDRPMCHTGDNNNKNLFSSRHNHLVKVHLGKRSSIMQHGDVVNNTYLVFTNLMKTSGGRVFMQQACRVKAEMILEFSSKRWRNYCKISENVSGKNELKTFVERETKEFVGAQILRGILKAKKKSSKSNNFFVYLKELIENSGAEVKFLFDSGKVCAYGSVCEVRNALYNSHLNQHISLKMNDFKLRDVPLRFPANRPMCSFKGPGMSLDKESLNYSQVQLVETWGDFQSCVLFFRHILKNQTDKLLHCLGEMKRNCFNNMLVEKWGKIEIIAIFDDAQKVPCCKVKFTSKNVADYVCEKFKSGNFELKQDLLKVHCFFDNQVEIPVCDTKIYPSVQKDAKKFNVKVREFRGKSFALSPENWREKDCVGDLIRMLAQKRTFVSRSIQNVDFGIPSYLIDEITYCLKFAGEKIQKKSKFCNFRTYFHYTTKPSIEIYGDDKDEVFKEFENAIRNLRNDIAHQKCSFLYFAEIQLYRNQFTLQLQNLANLRDAFPEVLFTVDSASQSNRDQKFPALKISTRNKKQGKNAYDEILDAIKDETNLSISSNSCRTSCCKCFKKMPLQPKIWKRKRVGDNQMKIELSETLSSLTLCGCLYCSSCLFNTVLEQIQTYESFHEVGLQCKNVSNESGKTCEQVILNRDLLSSFDGKRRKFLNTILEAAWRAKLQYFSWSRGQDICIIKCPNSGCQKYLISTEKSTIVAIFRCPLCSSCFCARCQSLIQNEISFKHHYLKNC